ncbi:MAG: GIY-YIG nuclease family protein [Parafannyhessea sp.]|uniref:GIY-YIG nuclease family protein n=1 Tax=Parafannyhessea sp. TaxID=2847324 RepID=UPI003F0F06FC
MGENGKKDAKGEKDPRPRTEDAASGTGEPRAARQYFVYMVSCEDGSVYTGITTDVVRRMAEHLGRSGRGARYTRTHPVTALVGLWSCRGRSAASVLEARIHRLPRARKDVLLARPGLAEDLAGKGYAPVPVGERERLWQEAVRRAGLR